SHRIRIGELGAAGASAYTCDLGSTKIRPALAASQLIHKEIDPPSPTNENVRVKSHSRLQTHAIHPWMHILTIEVNHNSLPGFLNCGIGNRNDSCGRHWRLRYFSHASVLQSIGLVWERRISDGNSTTHSRESNSADRQPKMRLQCRIPGNDGGQLLPTSYR